MKQLQQDAWVLHTRPYRETSLLVEFFTRGFGRVACVAKGVRGRKKVTPPRQFLPCQVSWVGRGPLFTMTNCELTPGSGLTGDALACGFYVNELVLRMLEPLDVHERLFGAYATSISGLASEESMSAVLRRFEYTLLQESGYLPDFSHTSDTGAPIDGARLYRFVTGTGFVETPASAGAATGEDDIPGTVLQAIAQGDFRRAPVRRCARKLFQTALRPHLGDRPLASRELLLDSTRSQ